MTAIEIVGTILGSLLSSTVAVSLLAYLRDRRKDNAQADVAEQTVDDEVDSIRVTALSLRIDLLEKARDAERKVLTDTIAHLSNELAEERADSEKKDAQIASLRRRVEEIEAELSLARRGNRAEE